MYLIEWHVVDGCFGLAKELKGAECERAGIGRQRRSIQNGADGGQGAAVPMLVIVLVIDRMVVAVMMVFMTLLRRLGIIVGRIGVLSVDQHAGFLRGDTAAIDGLEDEGRAKVERGGRVLKEFRRNTSVNQSTEEHVSTKAGKTFEIANAHGCFLYAAICSAR
jgi:hypothetical protein